MTVAWLDSRAFDLHLAGPAHPERPARLEAVREGLVRAGLDSRLVRVEPRRATRDELVAVHHPDYVDALERATRSGGGRLDPDTAVVPESWEAALRAAGAAVSATVDVLAGKYRRAFCSVRPPGHHALPDRAMGFCLFDNVAVAAQAAIARGLAKRVAILDWDVHHGNGTQDIFYERADVLYASWHQYPFYPGSGGADETGAGEGEGFTVNYPLPAESGDAALLRAWHTTVRPALERFIPEIIIVSAGFDADLRDPLGQLVVTPHGFENLSREVVAFADSACQGRVVSVLEGGYDLRALAEDVAVHVATLL